MKSINYQWILISEVGMEENELGRECEREKSDLY